MEIIGRILDELSRGQALSYGRTETDGQTDRQTEPTTTKLRQNLPSGKNGHTTSKFNFLQADELVPTADKDLIKMVSSF